MGAHLTLAENRLSISGGDLVGLIYDHLLDEDRAMPKRASVAEALQEIFPDAFVYTGGCHVALHVSGPHSNRDLMVTGNFPDWI